MDEHVAFLALEVAHIRDVPGDFGGLSHGADANGGVVRFVVVVEGRVIGGGVVCPRSVAKKHELHGCLTRRRFGEIGRDVMGVVVVSRDPLGTTKQRSRAPRPL